MSDNQKREYTKEPSSIREQIRILKSRGLIVNDEEALFAILNEVSYYRLSAYTLFFEVVDGTSKRTHKFYDDTTLIDIYRLYVLDENLRHALLNLLTKLEIYFKSKLVASLSKTNNSFILYDTDIIYNYNSNDINKTKSNTYEYHNTLNTIDRLVKKSSETFIKHYKKEYNNYPKLPIWMASEVMTCGNVSTLYSILKQEYAVDVLNNLDINYTCLKSWLHSITFIRNLCAHNSRIFNREISISPTLKKLDKLNSVYFGDKNQDYKHRIYQSVVMLDYLVAHTCIDKSFIRNIFRCLDQIVFYFPHAKKPMGIFFDGTVKSLYNSEKYL